MAINITTMVCRKLTIFVIVLFSGVVVTFSNQASDIGNLLKFKDSLVNVESQLSRWSSSIPPCKEAEIPEWQGVICEGGYVWGLKLDNMGLKGTINVDALKELTSLRTLSFINNSFEGPLPEIKKLGYLKTIYLSNNKFHGDLPTDAFDAMESLKKLYLDNNNLTGKIPNSLTTLGKLTDLNLENNQFSGPIPNFGKDRLIVLKVSNNKLEGPIPSTLSSMSASSFSGNRELCGPPLEKCRSHYIVPELSTRAKILLAIVLAFAIAAITNAVVIILLRRKKRTVDIEKSRGITSQNQKNVTFPNNDEHDAMSRDGLIKDGNKLSHLRNDRMKFDMSDLLKSSADMLGSGVFGSTYKATIIGGENVVVKRYKEMNNVDKQEFHEHMRRLGKLNHMNLIPLVACYYKKEEKLLVTDYVNNANLAVYLHGNKSRGLDWPTRLMIIRGVARGLMHLYNELPGLILPHGHLKSSNVLLSPTSLEPVLTDYGLIPLVNPELAKENMIAYKSPEYKKTRRINKKTDIWSLGILMLEIISGKVPFQQGRGNYMDITTWVQTFVKDDELASEVFDKDMKGTEGCEGEITDILKIALICCEVDVDRRWDIKDAVEKLG